MVSARFLLTVYVILQSFIVEGQSSMKQPFISPLDIPLVLSGNYGEIRSGHFHAGIDLKTQQVTGKRVLASREGYIARISVQSGGYGNALYLAHPGGYMTVYGHLREFMPDVQDYIKENQYRMKSFEVNLFPEPGMFRYSQGDLIGYSGNSGSSGGPHLHFEIRDLNSGIPLNVLNFNMPVSDNIAPRILGLAAYPLGPESLVDGSNRKKIFQVLMRDGYYTISGGKISVYGEVGFGIETYDYLNGSANRCSPYKVEMNLDGKNYSRFLLDSIPFDLTNYVSSHIDYEEKLRSGKVIQKLFVDPNNKLGIYSYSVGNGTADLGPDKSSGEVLITVSDVYGNQSDLKFTISAGQPAGPVAWEADSAVVARFYYKTANSYSDENVKVNLPNNVLFNNIDFRYQVLKSPQGAISDTFSIHDEYTPLYRAFTLSIRPADAEDIPHNKIYIASKSLNGEVSSHGGIYRNGWVTANPSVFGKFFLAVDTVPPVIRPVSFKNEGKYGAGQVISFRISDVTNGISKYSGTVDDSWVLFEYDAKNNLISYKIDPSRLKSQVMHELAITVTDGMNNSRSFTGKFFY